VVLYCIYVV